MMDHDWDMVRAKIYIMQACVDGACDGPGEVEGVFEVAKRSLRIPVDVLLVDLIWSEGFLDGP